MTDQSKPKPAKKKKIKIVETIVQVESKPQKQAELPPRSADTSHYAVVAQKGDDPIYVWGGFASRTAAKEIRNIVLNIRDQNDDLRGCTIRVARGNTHPHGTTVGDSFFEGVPQALNRRQRKNKRHAGLPMIVNGELV